MSDLTSPPSTGEETRAQETLRQVIDPELGMNVIDIGLVYAINVQPEYVVVEMTMTTPGCPMHESITGAAQRALELAFPGREVNVHLVWEPAWTPERLSASAKERLGFMG